jgi:3-oxoacyl-[acyl-carrier protein] reductase
MNLDLQGRRAIVCGSTRGIGKAIAHELALLGAAVTLLARDEARLKSVKEELPRNHGQQHEYLIADFDFPEKLKSIITHYAGQTSIDILVNNTGGPPAGPLMDAVAEEFIKAFSAHLLSSQILVQAVTPAMRNTGYGRIINIISTSVKIPISGLGVSNTIRGAVANWAKTLSLELAPFGITVNNVLPGSTMTDRLEQVMNATSQRSGKTLRDVRDELIRQIPARRIGAPEEVAAAAAFLASPAAAYINGINLPVDGGRTGSL